MDETTKRALADVLAGYEARRDRDISARKAEQDSVEKFMTGAEAAMNSVIMPCFQQFSDELEQHHHACSTTVQKREQDEKRSEAKITLTIFPNGTTQAQGNPWLSYTASAHRRKVAAHRCITLRSGTAIPGPIGEYEVEQINKALIDRHLLELAQTVFGEA